MVEWILMKLSKHDPYQARFIGGGGGGGGGGNPKVSSWCGRKEFPFSIFHFKKALKTVAQ